MADPANTKKKVEDLNAKIQDFKNHMHAFSGAMRSLYVDNDSGASNDAITKYRQLRDDTRNDGEVYCQAILPLSEQFVKNVDDYFSTFIYLTYDQWVQCLQDMVDEAKEYKSGAEVIITIHKNLITVLKKREDEATLVVKQLGELEKTYEAKYKELEQEAKVKHQWAVGLAFIPFIGAIASPILNASGDSDLKEAKSDLEQAKMTEAGSLLVTKTLLPAIDDFIQGLVEAAGFFQILIADFENFIAKGEAADTTRKFYFFMMQGQAKEMKNHCDMFYAVLPDVQTDFTAIPKPPNQDYVNQWKETEKKLIQTKLTGKIRDTLLALIK